MSHGKTSSTRPTFGSIDKATLEQAISKLDRTAGEMRAFDLATLTGRSDERLEIFQRRVNNVLADLVGTGSPDYKEYALGPLNAGLDTTFGDHYSLDEYRDALKPTLARAVRDGDAGMGASMAARQAPAPHPGVPTRFAFRSVKGLVCRRLR